MFSLGRSKLVIASGDCADIFFHKMIFKALTKFLTSWNVSQEFHEILKLRPPQIILGSVIQTNLVPV